MRKLILVAIVAVGILALLTLFWRSDRAHTLQLKAYFQNAHGLRPGAPVMVAGVTVGSVVEVRALPEAAPGPAEVVMSIATPYELKIPVDSTVVLATAGVLGEVYPDIEVQNATGTPAADGAVLKTRESSRLSTKDVIESIERIGNRVAKTQESRTAPAK